jgi:hypothetical protein
VYWNDSCSVEELTAIARRHDQRDQQPGDAERAQEEMPVARRILRAIAGIPAGPRRVSWQVYQELALNGAKLLLPVHERGQQVGPAVDPDRPGAVPQRRRDRAGDLVRRACAA